MTARRNSGKSQLNVWIGSSSRATLTTLAQGKHLNTFIEELIQQEAARRKGEILDTKTLPVMREMIQQEFLRVIADLQLNLREEMHRQNQEGKADIIAEMKARERRSDDRLASLIIRAIREGGISRRMLFTYLAIEDHQRALEIYEDAKAKVGKEIASRFNEAGV